MKKLVFFIGGLRFGGMERVIFIASELLKEKYDITIATLYRTDADYQVQIPIYDMNVPPEEGKINKLKVAYRRLLATKKMKKELNPDIVFSFGMYLNYLNALVRNKEKIVMGIRSHDWLTKPFVSTTLDKWIVSKFDLVNAVSKRIAADSEKYWDLDSRNVAVLYNPYDVEYIKQCSNEIVEDYFFDKSKKYIITMGRLANQKGFNHLVRVMAELVKIHSNVRLIIMGKGDKESDIRNLISSYGLEEYVDLIGGRTNPYKYIKHADLYVLSSHAEGFPNALVEAMSVGTPIVSVNCPSGPSEILLGESEYLFDDESDYICSENGILSREMIQDDSYVVKSLDRAEKALFNALDYALKNTNTVLTYAANAQKHVADFSYESFKESLISELERLNNVTQ